MDDDDDHVLSVHTTLVLGGYAACGVSAVFAIVLVLLAPGPVAPDGSLRFISEGMNAHCGFTNAVMGTCTLFVLACQLVLAAVHPQAGTLTAWALLQLLSWNVVMAVQDTGWGVHDVALGGFLLGNLMFHSLLSQHPVYGGPFFRLVNRLTWGFALVFGLLGLVHVVLKSNPTAAVITLKSFAVAFEFVFMLAFAAQNVCVVHALDQFQDIHLRLVPRAPEAFSF